MGNWADQNRLSLEDDPIACLAQTQAQICIRQFAGERFIEPADRFEDFLANRHAGTGDSANFASVIDPAPVVALIQSPPWIAGVLEESAVLNRAIRGEETRADGANSGTLCLRNQLC